MDKKEFEEKVSEQVRIKQAADVEIQRLRQEYIDSAPIKVGDVVKLLKREGTWPNVRTVVDETSEVRVSALSISYGYDICVRYINRKKKNGEFSTKDEVPYEGVCKDGVYYHQY
jgi:hypothetical protein